MTKTEIADALDRIKQIAEKLDEAITKLAIAVEKDEEAEKAEPAEEPKAEAAAATKPVTLEDVRAAMTDLTSAKGAATTKSLLAEYGAKKLSDIPADKYATLLADAKGWAGE